jgi:hypothetical protein
MFKATGEVTTDDFTAFKATGETNSGIRKPFGSYNANNTASARSGEPAPFFRNSPLPTT